MLQNRIILKLVSYVLLVFFPLAIMRAELAVAEFIDTASLLENDAKTKNTSLSNVQRFVDQSEVSAIFLSYGISPQEAKMRLSTLSDEELNYLASRINSIPAGGDGVGAVVGAVVFIFVLLIITDIIGFTKVFPFTRSLR
ncbi:MAG: PA2779 family protein [Deltaproteobacteria bacterium]|nr:PA2779 family protein [Deltaproteobacteria bacterium]